MNDNLDIKKEHIHITGLSDTQIGPVISRLAMEKNKQCLVVTSSATKAKNLGKTLSFFIPWKIHVLEEEESFFMQYEAKSHGQMELRLMALADLRRGEPCIVIAPVSAVIKKMLPVVFFDQNKIELTTGQEVELEELKAHLRISGFERVPFVENKGQYSIRGNILDVYPINNPLPWRIDFFDTEIDSIRSFEPETQRSKENLKSVELFPANQLIIDETLFLNGENSIENSYEKYIKNAGKDRAELLRAKKEQILENIKTRTNLQFLENYINHFTKDISHIWDYMRDGMIMLDDPNRLRETLNIREREGEEDFKSSLHRGSVIPEDYKSFPGIFDFELLLEEQNVHHFTPFMSKIKGVSALLEHRHIKVKQPIAINGHMDILEKELKRLVKEAYKVTIVCSTDERVKSLKEFLSKIELAGMVSIEKGSLTSGMIFPEEEVAFFWDGDIFNTDKRKRRTKKERKDSQPIKVFTDIKKGDFIVHENHGIGKFLGIEQLEVQKVKKDYLKIKYAGADVLYIPVEQMSIVQKYIGSDSGNPKISKLSSGEWKKAKAKAKIDIANLAHELLALSAARKAQKGYAFSKDTVWQNEFEDKFPYEETQDQLRSIDSIKRDMEKSIPMDRLLCGDVGYGKTEVAARAVFKCVADGKQAAILVPTTILANQHYLSFKKRFEDFPFTVEMLSRFRSEKQQEDIIDRMKKGQVDIVIGTHRIISKDVGFKDLGLLVIDEEQRFGVKHKEVVKELRKNIDVLALSATPIPRTLHMSLVGIRDMDLIEEPPENRYPVQTYVMEQMDDIMMETIRRELDRDGQVFVVYNKVKGIQRVAAEIRNLIPEAEVAVGHGQMNERDLENVMLDFIDGKHNVLVATTIIESGIDIPNANTMIILDADHFGLSQLYQLRGRVGRSNRMAYAYLLYKKNKILTEVAEKRLTAIKEFTEFGAGFKIAMRDLEIRGAGNLLGMEQHGHMMSIGYELYCKLVDDAVRALDGEVINPDKEEISFEIPITAFIPKTYIEDEVLKLQMYKKIAFVETQEDEEDIIDELLDRFGDIPKEIDNLIKISRVRAGAGKLGITRIREAEGKIFYELKASYKIDPNVLYKLKEKYKMNILIHMGSKPFIWVRLKEKDRLKEIIEFISCFMI